MSEASFASLSSSLLARKGGAKPAMRPQSGLDGPIDGKAAAASLEDLGWNDMGEDLPAPTTIAPAPQKAAPARSAKPEVSGSPRVVSIAPHKAAPVKGDAAPAPAANAVRKSIDRISAEIEGRVMPSGKIGPAFTKKPALPPRGADPVPAAAPAASAPAAHAGVAAAPPAPAQAKAAPVRAMSPQTVVRAAPAPVAEPAAPPAPARPALRKPAPSPLNNRRAAFTLRLDNERHLQLRLACTVRGRSAQQLVTDALDSLLAEMPEIASLASQVKRDSH